MRTSIKGKVLKTAFIDTLPILAAFLILGMGFGVLMSDAGYSPFFVFLMSAFIYAGSMQFVAVSLIAAKVMPITALLMTFLVNARHIFYGLSLLERYQYTGKLKPVSYTHLDVYKRQVHGSPVHPTESGLFH